jgi:hypothetical protein
MRRCKPLFRAQLARAIICSAQSRPRLIGRIEIPQCSDSPSASDCLFSANQASGQLVGMAILKDVILSIMIAVAAIIGAEAMEGLDGGL